MALRLIKSSNGGSGGVDLSDLLSKKKQAQTARRIYERDWMLNLAFIKGEQYVGYNMDTDRLVEIEIPDGYDRVIENVCLKINRIERAKILKTIPVPVAQPPGDGGQRNEQVARTLNGYFRWLQEKWHYERRLRNAVYWVVGTGNAFMKWKWDKATERPDMTVVSPFDIFPDPWAKTMQDARWMIHTNFMDVEEARETYRDSAGAKGLKNIKEGAASTGGGTIETRIYSNLSDGKRSLPGVVMNEWWRPPRRDGDEGEYVVFTDDGIVYEGPYPYDHNELPFTHLGHIEMANSIWYDSIITPVRPIQVEINRTAAQLVMNRNASQGKWFIPAELELKEMPNADALQILEAVAGSPDTQPVYIAVSSLPAWVVNELERQKAAAQDIAGQHEVSNAGVPGRVEAAQAIQLLQEGDDAPMKDTIHSMEEAVRAGFFQAACLHRQFGSAELLFNINGRDGQVEAHKLMKSDIPLEFTIDVKTTTGLPATIAGRWDRVLNLWQYKVITDPNRVLELLDLAPESPDLVPDMLDRKVAYRENEHMAAGKVMVPIKQDNHGVHRGEHEKYMKSEEFRALEPDDQEKFDYHLELHRELELEVAQEEAELNAVLQGMTVMPPGAPPGATPPAMPTPPPAQMNGSPASVAG